MTTTCPTPAAQQAATVPESPQKPRYTVARRDDAFVVRVDMPGVSKNAVNIEFHDDVLAIRGERATEQPASWKMLHQELSAQPYQLHLRINAQVDEEKLAASLEDGVLTLTLPLKPSTQPRRIEVN
ncbi:MAG: Hsp20/alpha crystallin family protein [Prosthecobacter sp.]|jgi:HSP20 family protein|nr:Hsp20/alpha crystallin family protein [Prosthecobacter sp.]